MKMSPSLSLLQLQRFHLAHPQPSKKAALSLRLARQTQCCNPLPHLSLAPLLTRIPPQSQRCPCASPTGRCAATPYDPCPLTSLTRSPPQSQRSPCASPTGRCAATLNTTVLPDRLPLPPLSPAPLLTRSPHRVSPPLAPHTPHAIAAASLLLRSLSNATTFSQQLSLPFPCQSPPFLPPSHPQPST